jgi:ATP-dependent helicase/nuclease subunit A
LPDELDDQQRQQTAFAADTLRRLRAHKDRMPLPQLIAEVLERTGYDAMLLAEFLGERKLANLYKLIEQARSFDRAGIFSLSDFIVQLSEFVARQPDEAMAATHPESADVVRLMSIHQSKGLEFPVVIVPDLTRVHRMQGPSVAFTPELGPMLKRPKTTTGYDLWWMAEKEEDLAEMSRLLYVAATRAADYLILSASIDNTRKASRPWIELIDRRMNSLLQVDCDRPSAPLVTVTSTEPKILSQPIDHRQRRDLLKMIEKVRQMADDGQGSRPRYLDAIAPDTTASRQHSFSRLTGRLHAQATNATESILDDHPSAILPDKARDLGTLVHAVLAEINFARPDQIAKLVQQHADEQMLTDKKYLPEAADMIAQFLASPRAKTIVESRHVHRELEFVLPWPPNRPEPGGRFFQGFIDCLYQDRSGQWRLIDYKTNRGVTTETIASTAAPYELQMLVYALAVENILQQPPAELTLCFLRSGLEYPFPWDDNARRRAVEMVAQALQNPLSDEFQAASLAD